MLASVRLPMPISDEQLYCIGEENPGWKVELVDGALRMTPVFTESGRQNARLTYLLVTWGDRYGWTGFDSSTGFKMPNRDVLCPDGALNRNERWHAAAEEKREMYAVLVPDVVVELASKSDSITAARRKCERWYRDGARYVILLDPKHWAAETWGEPPVDFPATDAMLTEILK